MQNTMIRGGGEWPAGEKIKIRSKGKKMKKGKEKRMKITIKMGGKALKMGYKLKKICDREIVIEMHNIYPCSALNLSISDYPISNRIFGIRSSNQCLA